MASDLARILLLSGSVLADDISTGIGCRVYGTEIEHREWRKKLMDKFGVWKSMPIQNLISQLGYYTPVVATYILEVNFNPDKQPELYQWVWLGVTVMPLYATVTNSLQLAVKGIEYLINK